MLKSSVTLHWPTGQNYDCVMCGRGCESLWSIPADDHVVEKISKHPLGLRVIDKNGAAFSKTESGGYIMHYADTANPRCGFLDDNKLCQIHAELGMNEKPTTCQQFPFHLTETPDGVYVGVSFFCTSVRENSGRPLTAHEDWLRELVARGARITSIAADGVQVSAEHTTTWADYVVFEQELRSRMAEQGLDLTVQQALVVVARAALAGTEIGAGWGEFELEDAPLGGALSSIFDTALFALVKLFLDDTTPERIAVVDEAFATGAALNLPEFGWKGSWFDFLRFQDDCIGEHWEDELDRWAAMQLHRKSLLVHRPLLDNLWMLGLVPRFIRCFTALYASQKGRSQATSEDYYRGLELAEMYLGTNGLLPTRIAPRFTAHLLEILG